MIDHDTVFSFRVSFILRIFYFRAIREVLNSRTSIRVVFMAYSDSLFVRTLNSRGNKFANIREN